MARATLIRARAITPSPGTPGEGWGEGLLPAKSRSQSADPLPNPLPEYRERGQESPSGVVQPNGFIACGDGAIEILELQPEGKRPMSLAAYKNGRPWTAGLRLESIV